MQVPNIKGLEALAPAEIAKTAAVVIEPLIQGAAGMRLWPAGHAESRPRMVQPHRHLVDCR